MRLPPLEDSPSTRLASAIAEAVFEAGGRTFFVGGCVRDRVLGHRVGDLDLEVYGVPKDALAALLSRIARVDPVGRDFGILKASRDGACVDVALPRTERKQGPGHRGFAIDSDPNLDPVIGASRRDLTINAVMEDARSGEILDPWGGIADARRGILRHVSAAFSEDPLRVLRVVQFAARLEFEVAPETLALCRSIDLTELATERIAGEFEKWLVKSKRPSRGLVAFVATGAAALAPEIGFAGVDPETSPNERLRAELGCRLDRAAAVRRDAPDEIALMLAVLFSDNVDSISDPGREAAIDARLATLALGSARRELTRLALTTWRSLRRLVVDHGQSLPAPDVRRLALRLPIAVATRLLAADGADDSAARLLRRAEELGVRDGPPTPFVLGRDLLAMGAASGPALGAMLSELFELQLDDRLRDRAAALELAKRWIETGRRDPPRTPLRD